MKPVYWHDIPLSMGDTVPVILSCPELSPELKPDLLGVTIELPPEQKIVVFINAAKERETQNRTLAHEFFHCTMWRKNGSLRLHYKKEESIADAFGTTGWRYLKIPRRPRGAAALERWARKQEANANRPE